MDAKPLPLVSPHNREWCEKIARLVLPRCAPGSYGRQTISVVYQDGAIQEVRESWDRVVR